MNILVILGSPRRNGNSETLVRTVVRELEQQPAHTIDSIQLSKLKISPCQSCGGCEKTGVCVIRDDMDSLYEKVDAADRLFLVSPVYFYGPTAQCKTFIDRFQARWSRKYLLATSFRQGEDRKAYLLATAATKGEKVFDASLLIAKCFFDAVNIPFGGSLVVRSVDKAGAIQRRPNEMQRASAFGLDILEGRI
ncbi:MAG: flavodoxin family protein [Desulfocapsaceae bacterium]|nr:flavodoxin family protein [Desulfocapsaceae bacterium]